MPIVGIRELARRASAIINEIATKKEPALITRRGSPVAYVLPIESEEFEDFALANAPEFVRGMAEANRELAAGETTSLSDFRDELAAESKQATGTAPLGQGTP